MESIKALDRIAFQVGPLTIYWYGLIIMTGILLGLWLATRESVRQGLPKDTFSDLLFIVLPVAIISARLYYVTFEWTYYSQNPSQIFAIWEGGIAIHGALLGSYVAGYIFSKRKKISFLKLADIAAPSIVLGQAIGRWGNFMNQEAHGREVSRAFLEQLYLPDVIINQMYIDGQYYHPTFLYESVWSTIIFGLLLYARRKRLVEGELFFSYLVLYSIGRFFIEGMRTDSLMLSEGLRVAQLVSIGLICIGISMIACRRNSLKIRNGNGEPNDEKIK
ncbi:prolipoprotein diacylglyceryl transferase [Domibacillus enclensis]|uniref:Phosphatidylglycerol--prolipoprotein diacylglyceryl transferase n=1 Tax=Domibacillus enclensis TaxID=1017273 RepID=A0A1N6W009_9BACI|nr:prolipoprotein diacylglyceryl transferase [Domibacillus enclensis]OXS77810.1 prolipoprotein diacylglyceryl transferase [Domibacillus enclensis]SIQ83368.1 Prolipoprotein diacylglyceryl transferase [Domibacillus enclensis]